MAKPVTNSLRIIGGQWRGRKLHFPNVDGLRPTGDRIRETLFNWLAPTLAGARCLDLFAGSGALGLEALSREAAHCVFVEADHRAVSSITQHLQLLGSSDGTVMHGKAESWLERNTQTFDLVFLDPPFSLDLLDTLIAQLLRSDCLKPDALVYVEFDVRKPPVISDTRLELLKNKKAGKTGYQLWRFNSP